MYKYRSKCRWNMLLHIDGEVVEIRPSEFFESKAPVESRYLELVKEKKKVGRPPKTEAKESKIKESDAELRSSTES